MVDFCWASNQNVDNVKVAAVIDKQILRSIESRNSQAYFEKVNVKCMPPFLEFVFIAPELGWHSKNQIKQYGQTTQSVRVIHPPFPKMVPQNQCPCPNNLTRLQQKQYNLSQFIRHAYLTFLKTLILDCGSNDYFRHKALQMKTLRKIQKTIKNCARLDSAGCKITHAMKQTLKNGELYFVLRQICNILHAQKNQFNSNQWNSVLIIDIFYICNSGLPIVETKQLLLIMGNITNIVSRRVWTSESWIEHWLKHEKIRQNMLCYICFAKSFIQKQRHHKHVL